jgi:serine/threonine protein kinase/Tol biopolymer transport system component
VIAEQISHYRIINKLGAGGMGEIYLAEDTKLGRKVALKLLPAEFTRDAGRVRRFEREARAASALNHPNILTIFEIGEANGERYIATEFIDGQTLRERLNGDRLAPHAALGIAAQIAAALAAAHQAGIVHRDIKPENVMLRRDGIVKVLDFGLAKLTEQRPAAVDSQAPTIAKVNTDPGTVLGTVGYMSPEQVRGQEADHRADIFSVGVILYEMLSGQRAFGGESAVEMMNAILKEEPPELGETNAKVSPQLEKIVRRCLEKKPERRFQSASDLGFALEALSSPSGLRLETQSALSAATENVGASSLRKQERMAWLVVAALLLVTVGFAWAYLTRQPLTNDARVIRFSISPPPKSSFGHFAVSPDGRHLAFTAATGGKVQLWVHAFDSNEARALDGTFGASHPFWSPDSRFIGFFVDGWLKKIDVTSGTVQSLCETPANPAGGAWNRAGVILIGQNPAGLLRVSATSGEVTPVTTLDRSRQEGNHVAPAFLPDGRHFLYVIQSGRKETRGIYLGSLDGTLKRQLLDDVVGVKYVAAAPGDTSNSAGWVLFGRDGALLARPFDTGRLDFTGEPTSLSDKHGRDFVVAPPPSISDNGVLVFDPNLKQRQHRQYRWVDRRGQTINTLDVAPGGYPPWLSHDEKHFIADRVDPLTYFDLWLYDVSGGDAKRFTSDPAQDTSPVWEPNGSRIVWTSSRDGGVGNLYQKAASGAGVDTLLWKSDYYKLPTDWSRDGRFIIYHQRDPKTKGDVWALPITRSGVGNPFPVAQTAANETAGTLSPDGRWLAYVSNESGRYDVWVQSFPDGGGKRQVSNGGGGGPRWRKDGRELFYYAGDGKLMAAQVKIGESFETSAAVPLFEFRAGVQFARYASYAVTADGRRFLINEVVDLEPNAPLTVVTNWTVGGKK